jgi:CTP:molybdopterin cytidylyltransferase MocA
MKDQKAGCIILSAGLSERMHSHKALLPFSNDENFLQHISTHYRESGIENPTVVANPGIALRTLAGKLNEHCFIINDFPERGRLYSIQLGLKNNPGIEWCFIQNIDNPFVTKELITQLFELRHSADCITPTFLDKGGHPVLISLNIINHILHLTDFNERLNDVIARFTRFKFPVSDEHILVNINTAEDYKRYFNTN